MMENTLEILGLENNNLDLVELLSNKDINIIKKIENILLLDSKCFDNPKSNSANEIAENTMKELYKFLDN